MKRLLLVLVAVSLFVPAAAHSAACSPLNCSPSQFAVAGTSLLGFRSSALGHVTIADLRTGARRYTLPGGFVDGHLLVHQNGRTLTWYDLRTGRKTQSATLPWRMRLAGASQDGSRAVGLRQPHGASTVVIATPDGDWRQVPLPTGNWDFDALRGEHLFLIRFLPTGGYQVVLVDLSTDSPTTRVIKDPRDSGTIWGSPFSRLSSPDGQYLFTLYLGSNGAAMVHELDLAHATARCIDLPGTGDYNSANSWGLSLSPDARTLWAVSPGYGRIVGIDVASRAVASHARIDLPDWNLLAGTRMAVSPDGSHVAMTDGETVALVGLADGKVAQRTKTKARAVGFAPGGRLAQVT